ncbi:hypothetical protein CY34DRAFT_277278 [Suillus luteus UH-Slu-Lm8-n1]|uniref:Uncharacterized protein n=1 Tax=Suillus luteus UH-Slu-Lm8-n1 TaxID=930992 RepID=A0A0C9ZR74_9AGAM|nr:hypothetical protein CY34DRAFT_277278 [Suillus luteus UH-Slu-Lm8-n1]
MSSLSQDFAPSQAGVDGLWSFQTLITTREAPESRKAHTRCYQSASVLSQPTCSPQYAASVRIQYFSAWTTLGTKSWICVTYIVQMRENRRGSCENHGAPWTACGRQINNHSRREHSLPSF